MLVTFSMANDDNGSTMSSHIAQRIHGSAANAAHVLIDMLLGDIAIDAALLLGVSHDAIKDQLSGLNSTIHTCVNP